ncbi:MAG: hypothetical protein WC679_01480 [Bacteroidales bacterium]|jgi:hypothetical protein
MKQVSLDDELSNIFVQAGFHVSSYNTIDANKKSKSVHSMAKLYYLRIGYGVIDIGYIPTFCRWANSTDFQFDIKFLITDGKIDLEKIHIFYLLLEYINENIKPTFSWFSPCIDISDYLRKVKRMKKRTEYIESLKKKRRHLRKHLLQ